MFLMVAAQEQNVGETANFDLTEKVENIKEKIIKN